MAVGYWAWVELVRDGFGDGFDFSVTVAGGEAVLEFVVVVVVRRCVGVVEGVTVRPGVVTVSDEAVVVVVVVWLSPSMCFLT